ncbi:MAG: DUF928 domain-containing protein [Leptolyngbyaceae cyanobacterium SL_7_1]|nr:DUF928 domain-containing protein [Leptolyngbyaceae cyanobacterium SL_7_1]
MEFVLIDDQEEDFYSQTFSLPETSGIVKIQIPTAQPGLEVDKRYHWIFSIICNSDNRSGDIAVDGWVRRVEVESDLARNLQKVEVDLRQQVRLYAEERLWHEMLSTMIALREANLGDQEIQAEWVELLNNVGLNEIVSQPVITCCQVQN